MLRSLTERTVLYLHPNQLIMLRSRGLRKQTVIHKAIYALPLSPDSPYDAMFSALRDMLKNPEWHGAKSKVLVAADFLRFRIAPADMRLTEEEKIALLRHQFTEIFGDSFSTAQISASAGGFRKKGLACAVDFRLIDTLKKAFEDASVPLYSVQPWLMAAFNRYRHQIVGNSAWLVITERSRISLALIDHGEWIGFQSIPLVTGWEDSMSTILDRMALQYGVEKNLYPLHFIWPEHPEYKPKISGMPIIKILEKKLWNKPLTETDPIYAVVS